MSMEKEVWSSGENHSCFFRGAQKRGVSAVVVVVLTIAITVSGVFIFWISFRSTVDVDFDDVNIDVALDIVSSSQFTAWDSVNKLVMVQVERGVDESDLIGLDLIPYFDGSSAKHCVLDVPSVNVMRAYYINLSGYGDDLVSIGVAPVFEGGKKGAVISELDVDDMLDVDILGLIGSGDVPNSFEKPNNGDVGGDCDESDLSCGIFPSCNNCDSNDGCSGTDLFDYFCTSNDVGCEFSSDDCSDCSCSCGGYGEDESIENGNCLDGVNNDCDVDVDCDDSGCYGHYTCCSDGSQNGDESDIDCGGSCVSGIETGSCTGGIDDDNDCLVDCADPDCFADVACVPVEMAYALHFTGFEADSTSPYDGWVDGGTDCIYSAAQNYCSDVSCPGAGASSIEIQDDSTSSVLYQVFDFGAPCDGSVCDLINFSFWIYPNSYDNVDEGWDVYCDYGDGDEINIVHWADDGSGCDVVGGVNVCEDVWTEVVVDLVGAGCTIDSSVELMFTGQESVRGLGNGDQMYIDGINITGVKSG